MAKRVVRGGAPTTSGETTREKRAEKRLPEVLRSGYDDGMSIPDAPTSILLGRFRRLARRDSHTWQGGIIRWPFWVDSPDGGRPLRPWGALWVTKPDGLVGFKLAELTDEAGPRLAAAALVDLALRHQGQLMGRPGRIEVADAALGAAVVAALGDPGVAVDVVDELTEVNEAVASFVEFQARDSGVPGLLSTKGVTLDDVREFASAAVCFHRAEPWQHLANEDLVAIEMAGLDKAARVAIVMGNGGMQFGMALYPSMAAAEAMLDAGGRPNLRSTYWAMTFSLPEEVPMPDLLLWEGEGLPLATPDSFPVAIGYASGDRVSRPSRALLRNFTAIMSALAETTEAEMDGGRWTKRVSVGGAAAEVTPSLPGLLDHDATAGRARPDPGIRARTTRARGNRSLPARQGVFDHRGGERGDPGAVQRSDHAMPSTASTPAERGVPPADRQGSNNFRGAFRRPRRHSAGPGATSRGPDQASQRQKRQLADAIITEDNSMIANIIRHGMAVHHTRAGRPGRATRPSWLALPA